MLFSRGKLEHLETKINDNIVKFQNQKVKDLYLFDNEQEQVSNYITEIEDYIVAEQEKQSNNLPSYHPYNLEECQEFLSVLNDLMQQIFTNLAGHIEETNI